MATGPLKILDFLNRGAMDRRLGPNWQQEEQDRQLKNQLLVQGSNRADITSALAALDKLDELKQKGLASDVQMGYGAAHALPGENPHDAYVRTKIANEEQDRQLNIEGIKTKNKYEAALADKARGMSSITPDDAKNLAQFGIHLTPGQEVDDSVLSLLGVLRGHQMASEASAHSARAMGQPQALKDEQGNITGWAFPATGAYVPNTHGGRASGMGSGELDRRGMLKLIGDSVNQLETVAQANRGAIGYYAGKATSARRSGALDFLGLQTSTGVNDLFHISKNLSDLLLRARSGAQINEQEYQRLSGLTPNPEGGEARFFDDLRKFKEEFNLTASVRHMGTGPGGTSPIPDPFGNGEGGPALSLADQARAELARRRMGR